MYSLWSKGKRKQVKWKTDTSINCTKKEETVSKVAIWADVQEADKWIKIAIYLYKKLSDPLIASPQEGVNAVIT